MTELPDDLALDPDRFPGLLGALLRRGRLLWQARYRADVVETLPQSAPPGHLLVTPGDPNLYVGTGTGLRKIPTQAV